MKKTILNEINEFNRLSGLLKEGDSKYSELYSDLLKLFQTASDEMKKSEKFQKLIKFFKDLIPETLNVPFQEIFDKQTNTKKLSADLDFPTSVDDDFYKSILDCINAPVTKDNMLFFYAWRQSEGGTATNNPFNTTMKTDKSSIYGKNVDGVQNYSTPEEGIEATCKTLKLNYYEDIVDGLIKDVGLYDLSRMESLNTWGTKKLISDVVDGYLKGVEPKPKPIKRG